MKEISRHVIALLVLAGSVYFVPTMYEAYLRHVEFPRVRRINSEKAICEGNDYDPIVAEEAPSQFEFVIVTTNDDRIAETYYVANGTVTEIYSEDGEYRGSSSQYRGNQAQMAAGTVAVFFLFGLGVVSMLTQLSGKRFDWNTVPKWQKLGFLYSMAVVVLTIIYGLTGLWEASP